MRWLPVFRARRRFVEARDADQGTYPPRGGRSEARARYWEWRAVLAWSKERN